MYQHQIERITRLVLLRYKIPLEIRNAITWKTREWSHEKEELQLVLLKNSSRLRLWVVPQRIPPYSYTSHIRDQWAWNFYRNRFDRHSSWTIDQWCSYEPGLKAFIESHGCNDGNPRFPIPYEHHELLRTQTVTPIIRKSNLFISSFRIHDPENTCIHAHIENDLGHILFLFKRFDDWLVVTEFSTTAFPYGALVYDHLNVRINSSKDMTLQYMCYLVGDNTNRTVIRNIFDLYADNNTTMKIGCGWMFLQHP